MKKKFVSLLLAIIMCVVICVPAIASISSDTEELQTMINNFFEAKEENFVSGENTSMAEFFTPSVNGSLETKTFSKLFQFEKQVRSENDSDIINETFSVTINDVSICDDTAEVSAYEYYEYELVYADGEKSSRGTNFIITCEKVNGEWKINNISTDNELEQLVEDIDSVPAAFGENEEENNIPISDPDIERAHEQAAQLKEEAEVLGIMAADSYTFHWYSGLQALTYALTYSNSSSNLYDTSSYNDLFRSYNPNDCQNFVSQCVWAGLYGENAENAIEYTHLPMITESGREWWATSSEACSNGTWTTISGFSSYVENGGEGTIGLVGAVGAAGQIANGYAGDMIHIRNSDGWYHTYIVVEATGTSGSRTNENYYICAHTTNRRNETLKSFLGTSQSNLRLLTVSGSYY